MDLSGPELLGKERSSSNRAAPRVKPPSVLSPRDVRLLDHARRIRRPGKVPRTIAHGRDGASGQIRLRWERVEALGDVNKTFNFDGDDAT
jgi:hypothetical protein